MDVLFRRDKNYSYTNTILSCRSIKMHFPWREDINEEHIFPWKIIIELPIVKIGRSAKKSASACPLTTLCGM